MKIRTVLGDLEPERLGRTDYHEHLFQVTPLLPEEDLDDEEASRAEAESLRRAGIDAMVDATPPGLGRDPAAVARISAGTGLHVVLTTGAHRESHYRPDAWPRTAGTAQLAEAFRADLTTGDPAQGIRAGLLKAGIGYWSISPFERRVIEAVGVAHRVTGAPVTVHLEHGSAAFEVLELLDSHGVSAGSVALAHADRNPDPGLHAELCAAGVYLGYDGMARHRNWPDSVLIGCLLSTIERVGDRRLLLGGDVARRSRYRAYGGMPGLDYLPRRFLPRLQAEAGGETVHTLMVANPAAWLTWHPAT